MQIKMNRRFAGVLALTASLGALATAGLIAPSVLAQNGAMSATKKSPIKAGEVGSDKNVTDATRGSAKAIQPAKKGGTARAGACRLLVDNWTALTINLYVDGRYAGNVSPYGEAAGYYSTGSHTLYGRVEDGTHWGPRTIVFASNKYTWRLNPD